MPAQGGLAIRSVNWATEIFAGSFCGKAPLVPQLPQSMLFYFHPATLYVGYPIRGCMIGLDRDPPRDRQQAEYQPFGMFEVTLTRRKRLGWRWQVRDQSGKVFADGFERSRPAAKYHGERALFFLLSQAHLNKRSAAASED